MDWTHFVFFYCYQWNKQRTSETQFPLKSSKMIIVIHSVIIFLFICCMTKYASRNNTFNKSAKVFYLKERKTEDWNTQRFKNTIGLFRKRCHMWQIEKRWRDNMIAVNNWNMNEKVLSYINAIHTSLKYLSALQNNTSFLFSSLFSTAACV